MSPLSVAAAASVLIGMRAVRKAPASIICAVSVGGSRTIFRVPRDSFPPTHGPASGRSKVVFLLLACCTRYIVNWDLRESMTEADIEIILERAKELYPEAKPQIISDNGPRFITKDFKELIRLFARFAFRRTISYTLHGLGCRPGQPGRMISRSPRLSAVPSLKGSGACTNDLLKGCRAN